NVSKHVAWLEKELGLQLLRRSTKQVSLTQAGQSMLDKGHAILQLVDDTEHEVRRSVSGPVGVLRVGTPPSFGAVHLVPALSAFCRENPGIQVETYFDDGRADITPAGLDIAIRIAAQLLARSLVACRLTLVPDYLVAAPSYLADHPPIRSPMDLSSHNCLVHALTSPTQCWNFHHAETG